MKTLRAQLRRPLVAVAGFSCLVNLLLLVPALFMLQVFDRVLSSSSRETLLVLLLGVGVALALMLALDYVRSRLQALAGSLLHDSLMPRAARELLRETARRTGPVSTERLRDVATLRGLFSAHGLLALFDAPWALVYLAVIWLAHPVLGIAAGVAMLMMFGVALVNDWLTRRELDALQRAAAGASGDLEASVHNAEVVETLGMSEALLARWRELNARVLGLQSGAFRKSAAMASMTRSLRQAVQVAILAVGAWLVITQAATPGIMVATTILLGRALAPVEQIVGSWRLLAEGRAAWRRLRGLADADVDLATRMKLPAPAGRLEAGGVALRAPGGERLILGGVSLALAPGEVLAVVGPSGAGKSSLVRVLAGVWPPSAGAVRLDGVELGQWTREALGPHIGYVPQDVELFRATVAENIARLGPVDSEAVLAAAQSAGVHEMILELPDGYDTQVEPAGGLLSPGQRQRIALARALYGSPKLLLLDEPNSNLDGAGEQALGQAISALRGKVTTVMVTHRSTLVQHADKMLVLEAGQVRHFGKVGEVMQALAQNAARSGAQVVQMPRAGEGS